MDFLRSLPIIPGIFGWNDDLPVNSENGSSSDPSNEQLSETNEDSRSRDGAKDNVASNAPLDDVKVDNGGHGHPNEESCAGSCDSGTDSGIKAAGSHESAACVSGESDGQVAGPSNGKIFEPPLDSAAGGEKKKTESEEDRDLEALVAEEYVSFGMKSNTKTKDVLDVMKQLREFHYDAAVENIAINSHIHPHCKTLFERDYICKDVNNFGGTLCRYYPVGLIIPVCEKPKNDERTLPFDTGEYISKVEDGAAVARCRRRFVVPVILFDKKFICRSATLSNCKTAAYENLMKPGEPEPKFVCKSYWDWPKHAMSGLLNFVGHRFFATYTAGSNSVNYKYLEKIRSIDKEVLKMCAVEWICDLMVEKEKLFKTYLGNIYVSSSEKADPEFYEEFRIEKMPYPGCEFFKKYHGNNHIAEGLRFEWENEKDVNVNLALTEHPKIPTFNGIEWDKYKEWDIIQLTKNYMKVLLYNLVKNPSGGLLLHCISGWDRTPLFISLLRASLWADGVIHKSLKKRDMAYLMIAYDWYMFGHNLPARLKVDEEVMHFCFNFLSHLEEDEFSVTKMFSELTPEQQANGEFPEFQPGRRKELKNLSKLLLETYKKSRK